MGADDARASTRIGADPHGGVLPAAPRPGTLGGRPLLLALVPPDLGFASEVLAAGADLVLVRLHGVHERRDPLRARLECASSWLASLPRARAGVVVGEAERETVEPWLVQHAPAHVVVGPRSGGEWDAVVRSIGAEAWHLDLPLDHDDAVEGIDLAWSGSEPDLVVATLVSVLEDTEQGWACTGTAHCAWSLPDLARAARHHRLLLSVDRASVWAHAVLAAAPAVRGFWVCVSPEPGVRAPAYGFGHEVGVEEVRTLAARLAEHEARSLRVGADGVEAGHREQVVHLRVAVDRASGLSLEQLRREADRLAEDHGAALVRLGEWRAEVPFFEAIWAAWEGEALAAAVRRWVCGLGEQEEGVTLGGVGAERDGGAGC